jgi:RimJ/RimL family protein N-acetyltransferase
MSIVGNNLHLRAIEESDLPVIQTWRNDDRLRRYFREYRDFSLLQLSKWYHNMIHDNRFEFFIIESNDGTPLGVTGITYIDWVNKHADVHFYIGHNFKWIDTKYSDEAFKLILDYGFNYLNLNKLWAEIYEIDTKKLEFFNSYQFKTDATLRDHYYYKGQYYNSHILSLLKNEYK